jgi:hypothetical protein
MDTSLSSKVINLWIKRDKSYSMGYWSFCDGMEFILIGWWLYYADEWANNKSSFDYHVKMTNELITSFDYYIKMSFVKCGPLALFLTLSY